MKPKLLNAWHSNKQEKVAGYCIYERADGSQVIVTAVSDTEDHGCAWDDMTPMGKVVKCIKSRAKTLYIQTTMKPLPNLLFVKSIKELQEDMRSCWKLHHWLELDPRRLCEVCGEVTPGTLFCGLCSSALVESQINSENLPTAR